MLGKEESWAGSTWRRSGSKERGGAPGAVASFRSTLVVSVSPNLLDLLAPFVGIPAWVHQVVRPVGLQGDKFSVPSSRQPRARGYWQDYPSTRASRRALLCSCVDKPLGPSTSLLPETERERGDTVPGTPRVAERGHITGQEQPCEPRQTGLGCRQDC